MTLKTINHFTFDLNKKLGEGSTGTVYLGTDQRNNQIIAVKAIQLKNIDNEVTQYLLKNEIKALQLTNHPNVLKAIDVIYEPQFIYIVTDYLPGGTLAEYIQKHGFIPENQALNIFKQLVQGYEHIFDLQIFHRDLKPHNILFDSNFKPVLSDFGYCQITGFLPKPSLSYNVGSPGFMAPESIVGNLYSENSQIWSLGAILYEMMTGRNYTNGRPVMQAVMLIKTQGPYYPQNSSEFTKIIMKHSMMLKPQQRIKVKTLKQLLNGQIQASTLNIDNSENLNITAANIFARQIPKIMNEDSQYFVVENEKQHAQNQIYYQQKVQSSKEETAANTKLQTCSVDLDKLKLQQQLNQQALILQQQAFQQQSLQSQLAKQNILISQQQQALQQAQAQTQQILNSKIQFANPVLIQHQNNNIPSVRISQIGPGVITKIPSGCQFTPQTTLKISPQMTVLQQPNYINTSKISAIGPTSLIHQPQLVPNQMLNSKIRSQNYLNTSFQSNASINNSLIRQPPNIHISQQQCPLHQNMNHNYLNAYGA